MNVSRRNTMDRCPGGTSWSYKVLVSKYFDTNCFEKNLVIARQCGFLRARDRSELVNIVIGTVSLNLIVTHENTRYTGTPTG